VGLVEAVDGGEGLVGRWRVRRCRRRFLLGGLEGAVVSCLLVGKGKGG
jgi:hypothetical protein